MKTITLIDDERDLRETLAEILEEEGYTVHTAADGRQGWSTLSRETPDLIICDIMMPEMDGYGVLKNVKASDNLKHTPFLFLTAMADQMDVSRGLDAGVDGYVLKPVDIDELLELVELHLD